MEMVSQSASTRPRGIAAGADELEAKMSAALAVVATHRAAEYRRGRRVRGTSRRTCMLAELGDDIE